MRGASNSRRMQTVMNRVLIIDDDEELCDLVSEYLTVEGFKTHCVHDGETGLQQAKTGDYDLTILDVMLPKMYGFDVLRNLREESDVPRSEERRVGKEYGRGCESEL